MDMSKYKPLLADNIVAPMTQFMQGCGDDCEFTQEDIQTCENILLEYVESLAALSSPADKDIMECVKKAVLALNELNENTDYALIETEERENIWELIQTAAVDCGLQDPADDVTEEWRDW